MLAERGEIARQGRRIAGNVDDSCRAQRADIGFNSLGAAARRVEDDLGIILALLFELR